MTDPQAARVETYLRELQARLCAAVEAADGQQRFLRDAWRKPPDSRLQGHGETCVLEDGAVFERAGVALSVVQGPALPPSASHSRPELAGRPFAAMGVSAVFHPRNPYVPTTHCNVRMLAVEGEPPARWFGGGFDLTPYYGYEEDARHWHQSAQRAVGAGRYPAFKAHCDRYFFLPHRQEPRGIGGLFFDDWQEGGFEPSFALMRAVGDAFWPAYAPILERRRDQPFGERERRWQLLRRGRYVEFNLVWDRGTLFGLQSGGRSESILMSLPPNVQWSYAQAPEPGSEEERLLKEFLVAKDWI
jgi:coproporphyrinogen III oxidase